MRIFRVDNPHTKPFAFWEWLIASVRASDPDVIFLAEAFTRPKIMHHLAKIGFAQSYTYFTWRNTKDELAEYLRELNEPPVRDFFRPHFFVNTPDINPYFLQTAGRPGFLIRAALAATLSGLWGVYSASNSARLRPCPAARNIATRRNTRSSRATGTRRATSSRRSRRSTAAQGPAGAADASGRQVLQCLQSEHPLLRQASPRRDSVHPHRDQPRSARAAGMRFRDSALGMGTAGRRRAVRRRYARRPAFRLARQVPASAPGTGSALPSLARLSGGGSAMTVREDLHPRPRR